MEPGEEGAAHGWQVGRRHAADVAPRQRSSQRSGIARSERFIALRYPAFQQGIAPAGSGDMEVAVAGPAPFRRRIDGLDGGTL